jgi:3-hydroxybutyryl-CoA dehydrogenase
MDILIVGTQEQAEECRQKFGGNHIIHSAPPFDVSGPLAENAGVVFDFSTPDRPNAYTPIQIPVFFDTSIVRLADVILRIGPSSNLVFGFCGLRTFLNREILEVACRSKGDLPFLASICKELGTDYRVVADQSGMVTPRVICMIINEAYCTLEEGTATREDIDLAMKLGTNYPLGPFEWGERIGLGNVVAVLNAARLETGDGRYKVCDLLQQSARH